MGITSYDIQRLQATFETPLPLKPYYAEKIFKTFTIANNKIQNLPQQAHSEPLLRKRRLALLRETKRAKTRLKFKKTVENYGLRKEIDYVNYMGFRLVARGKELRRKRLNKRVVIVTICHSSGVKQHDE